MISTMVVKVRFIGKWEEEEEMTSSRINVDGDIGVDFWRAEVRRDLDGWTLESCIHTDGFSFFPSFIAVISRKFTFMNDVKVPSLSG